MNIFPFNIIIHQLYLLQLENYHLPRYWPLFWQRGFWPGRRRQQLVWTMKLKLIAGIAAFIYLGLIALAAEVAVWLSFPVAWTVLAAVVIGWLAFGLWAMLATLALWPADYFVKQQMIRQARRMAASHGKLTIIGITGSYGKTTMKEVLAAVLCEQFHVLKTEANKNTPLGLATLVLGKLTPETEILLVEMGAYRRGDIKALCDIVCPHVSVLTGINESHLERFGDMDNTIAAKFELVRNARPDAVVVLNADDELVSKHYHDYVAGKQAHFYSAYNDKRCPYRLHDKRFAADTLHQHAEIVHPEYAVGAVEIPLLGEYAFGDVIAAVTVARVLGMTAAAVRRGIGNITPIEHRLQPIKGQHDILVIDDSYNGSPHGVEEAVRVLERFTNRRKIFVTPGLVETGERTRELHEHIGRRLGRSVDVVVLIQNSVTAHILKGLYSAGFTREKIMIFKNATEAHRQIQKLTLSGDVVLFQNDWPDNYA